MVVALSFLYRLPPLLNAGDTNSDAAIVGLQAMHILRGEFSWHLFGSTYQTSVDSAVAALWFLPLGATPFALMLSSLVGHVLLTLLSYAVLTRHLPKVAAAVLVLALVFCSAPVHGNALYPPRQAALTLVFLAMYFIECIDKSSRDALWAGAGGAMALLACFADPYALLFLPLVGLHLLLVARDPSKGRWLKRLGAGAVGAAMGVVPLVLLLGSPESRHGETKMTLDVVEHNWAVLREACLPWVLGTKVYAPLHEMDYVPWTAPPAIVAIQWLGLLSLAGLLLASVFLVVAPGTPWGVRRIGAVGLLSVPLTVSAFLVSPMVMDQFSARYLVAMLLFLPWAFAPVAHRAKGWRFGMYAAPYLASAAIGGWVAYAPAVSGLAVRTGLSRDDEAMGEKLRALGVRVAMADYWVAYRETFLFRESPIVVPSHLAQDRYRPYRDVFAREREYAYLVDRWRSEEPEATVAERLALSGARYDRIEVGDLVAFVVHAPPEKTPGLASR
ncbi:hypothetical protein LVJ94_19115 [Pendulispora rubella]|uniref:Glycosyltransferase RgtA/B/C/D-like domain-containing protein n=1 Tax=Pendulispora rubella TaxID=2741070 RepID=A0ABZ2LHS8_9BACT